MMMTSSSSLTNIDSVPSEKDKSRPSCKVSHSWRDKLSKLKDVSFRLKKNGSVQKIEAGSSAEFFGTAENNNLPKKQKNVSFASELKHVREFEPLAVPPGELWWTSEDINLTRSEGKLCAATDAAAQEYFRAFAQACNQVHKDRKLKAEYMQELVQGLAQDYRGLEHYAASSRRGVSIREHVLSVVNCYHDRSSIYSSSFSDSSLSLNSASSHSAGNATCYQDRAVRNQSAKLSAGDRHFAAAMGKADRLASVYKEDVLSEFKNHRRLESV